MAPDTASMFDREIHPADFSVSELEFLVENDVLGMPPPAVEAEVAEAPGVNPNQIMPLLRRVYDLTEMERVNRLPSKWCGVEAIKDGLAVYLKDIRDEVAAKKQNPYARRPKLGAFDLSGNFHPGMVGSDSGRVRSKWVKDEQGRMRKVTYTIKLFPSDSTGTTWLVDDVTDAELPQMEDAPVIPARFEVVVDRDGDGNPVAGRITNPIDQHSENFKPGHRTSENAAWERMRKHCLSEQSNADLHRALAQNIEIQREEAY